METNANPPLKIQDSFVMQLKSILSECANIRGDNNKNGLVICNGTIPQRHYERETNLGDDYQCKTYTHIGPSFPVLIISLLSLNPEHRIGDCYSNSSYLSPVIIVM